MLLECGARQPPAHSRTKQPGIGAGRAARRACARYALGVMPTSRRKRALNVPRLVKPTRMQISVTVRLADAAVPARARSAAG